MNKLERIICVKHLPPNDTLFISSQNNPDFLPINFKQEIILDFKSFRNPDHHHLKTTNALADDGPFIPAPDREHFADVIESSFEENGKCHESERTRDVKISPMLPTVTRIVDELMNPWKGIVQIGNHFVK
jgi:hypothetical protein